MGTAGLDGLGVGFGQLVQPMSLQWLLPLLMRVWPAVRLPVRAVFGDMDRVRERMRWHGVAAATMPLNA